MTEYDGLREERRAVAFLATLPLHSFNIMLPVPLHGILPKSLAPSYSLQTCWERHEPADLEYLP